MGNIKIILQNDINRVKDVLENNFGWLYLGRDIAVRHKLKKYFGENNRYYIDGEIQKVAIKEQNAFLTFLSRLGGGQKKQIFWWASQLSYRNPSTSDLFVIMCYQKFLRQVCNDINKMKDFTLIVIVDDIWLYKSIEEEYGGAPGIVFASKLVNFRLGINMVRLFCRGVMARLVFFIKIVNGKITAGKNDLLDSKVAFYSWVEKRSFYKNQFHDPYLGELERIYKQQKILYITPLLLSKDLKEKCKKFDKSKFIYLDSLVGFWDLLIAVGAIFFPRYDFLHVTNKILLLREIFQVFSNNFFNLNLLNYYAFTNLLNQNKNLELLIYPFENQPYEKMICLAKKNLNHKVHTVGYQHSSVSKLLNNYFLGKDEEKFIPFPDYLFTNGSYTFELLKNSGGYPAKTSVVNGGALRYAYLNDKVEVNELNHPSKILISLTFIPALTESMLEALFVNFLKMDKKKQLIFYVKFHPDVALNKLSSFLPEIWPSHFQITDEPIKDLLSKVDLVIYSSSTVGIEAIASGKKVLKYQSETILDLDPLDDNEEIEIDKCFDRDFKKKVIEKLSGCDSDSSKNMGIGTKYFSPVNEQYWIDLLD